jgi:hypothetical protein
LNDEGLRIALDKMVHRSVANPAIRRCELMVRMRGFEDIANEQGLAGEFYTITAPSRYHAVHSKGGFVGQWNGCNPQDTQRYLCNVWAKCRAAISRAGIHIFGFRVVEPHHDGTPHWHMLLFMRPQDVDTVRDIICYHARIADSEELQSPQALKARFHVEPIDPERVLQRAILLNTSPKILTALRSMVKPTKKAAKACGICRRLSAPGHPDGVSGSFSRLVALP